MGDRYIIDGAEVELPSNTSGNTGLPEDVGRRRVLEGSAVAVFMMATGGLAALPTQTAHAVGVMPSPFLGFEGVPVSAEDTVVVPKGYRVQVLYQWGDAIGHPQESSPESPLFSVKNTAEEQALQAGMHHDGMHFFPFPKGNAVDPHHGLLVMNHEYTDDGLLHLDGMLTWSAKKVAKSQAAHGVSVVEIRYNGKEWALVRPSRFARRLTASTPMSFGGPAKGSAWLKTGLDPSGETPLGTLNNCSHGVTPWGTYLTGEENWDTYFNGLREPTADQKRYGVRLGGRGYRWHEHDPRFDVSLHPNEPHRFGWVVEVNPMDPNHVPVKRTALGRFKHEGATVHLSRDNRAVVYMGDDERFEYVYKFVSKNKVRPGGFEPNKHVLDEGALYVLKIAETGNKGEWVLLEQGKNGLTSDKGFSSQADVVVRCRQAADTVGATTMDRAEWIAVHPNTGMVYVALTNNGERGKPGSPDVNPANPRANNVFGQILQIEEEGGDAASTVCAWGHFVLAGNPPSEAAGGGKRDVFGSPDGVVVDARGVMWICTDVSTSTINKGAYAGMGNNQLLAANPMTGEIRRFLTGPRGCELTATVLSPDLRTLFVNIQHPGETPSERADPGRVSNVSSWPNTADRPRSATLAITREDGGIISA